MNSLSVSLNSLPHEDSKTHSQNSDSVMRICSCLVISSAYEHCHSAKAEDFLASL